MLRGIKVRRRPEASSSASEEKQTEDAKKRKFEEGESTEQHEPINESNTTPTELKREEWMLAPPKESSRPLFGGSSSSGEDKPSDPRKNIQNLELNPNLNPNAASSNRDSDNLSSLSWRARALKRAEERARESGVSVDAVLKEHWGDESKIISSSYDRETLERLERNAQRNKHFGIDKNMKKPEIDQPANTRIYDKYKSSESSKRENLNVSRFGTPQEETFMRYATMSQDELNNLAQKALDADSRGDKKLYKELSDQLTEIKKCKELYKKHGSVAQLPSFYSSGKRIDGGAQGRKYIGHQGDQSLKELYLEAKEHSVQDFDRGLANNILKDTQYRSSSRNASEYDDQYYDQFVNNTGNESFEIGDDRRAKKKKRQQTLEEKQQAFLKKHKMYEFQKKNHAETCLFCFENKKFKNHLVIATGNKAYLTLSPFGCLTEGHCCIAPILHTVSIRETDEDVYEEIMKFKVALKKMFVNQGKDCLFLETVTPYSLKHEKHAFIECIPLSPAQVELAPSYFKNAILDLGNTAYNQSASEWSENKRLIDTKGKGIHRSIPKDFPYFHVEFQVNGGFAHPIDSDDFSFTFGKEVICGMLKRTPNEAKLRPPRYEEERKQAFTLMQAYSEYDWTKTELGSSSSSSGTSQPSIK
ncbi:hypothetical protein FDP41_003280 [Naegleria fowleri]|uniref:Cwf19-like C-terminal domain-containing protein n=1 Tax=Naegleria fowleri TaxID=5763 RepID=A0A6A5BVJ2_NAEFO|nr:uncharacterized protein FDP41_003280 [Naegleria fowleri]KAF0977958.1 hypothetical protein FDP41_003280 [Naegleria fowleri]CAG4711967.1 unnamed protein product [Naegleria fowleri]